MNIRNYYIDLYYFPKFVYIYNLCINLTILRLYRNTSMSVYI